MKIAISAESTIDLSKELLEQFRINTVPFTILLGSDQLLDGEIDSTVIFDYYNKTKTLPKTSAVNEYQYETHFENLLETNDAVIHLSLSSELSSACQNATLAAEKYDGKVHVIDSRTLSTGIALLAIYASKLIKRGLSPVEIADKVKERIPFVQASFELFCLEYLYKGGRCSFIQFFGANLFKIRPQIIVSDGKMVVGSKYRGDMGNVVEKYVQDVLNKFNNPDLDEVFITYSTYDGEIIENVKRTLKERGFKNIYVTMAGGTICSHCGDHSLGILYINDGGEKD